MAKVLNGEEKLPLQTTDRQTDRERDGRAIAYSEREPEFTFAKNACVRRQQNRFLICTVL